MTAATTAQLSRAELNVYIKNHLPKAAHALSQTEVNHVASLRTAAKA